VGVNCAGAFAEYIVLPMTNIWRHAAEVPLEVAAIFDPLGNAVHTALAFPVLGEDVLVTGAGPIGTMAAAVAKHAGARNVVITDLNPYRLELEERLKDWLHGWRLKASQIPRTWSMRSIGCGKRSRRVVAKISWMEIWSSIWSFAAYQEIPMCWNMRVEYCSRFLRLCESESS
jgi:hypothetical protein